MNDLASLTVDGGLPRAVAACLALRGEAVSQAVVAAHLGGGGGADDVLRGLVELGIPARWLSPAELTEEREVVAYDAQGHSSLATLEAGTLISEHV